MTAEFCRGTILVSKQLPIGFLRTAGFREEITRIASNNEKICWIIWRSSGGSANVFVPCFTKHFAWSEQPKITPNLTLGYLSRNWVRCEVRLHVFACKLSCTSGLVVKFSDCLKTPALGPPEFSHSMRSIVEQSYVAFCVFIQVLLGNFTRMPPQLFESESVACFAGLLSADHPRAMQQFLYL